MHKFTQLFILLFLASAVILLESCTDNSTSDTGSDFDRPAMLANYGNNTILPAYQALQQAAGNLNTAAADFSNEPSQASLAALQAQLKATRLAWQDANIFQFGPAQSLALRAALNTFPADTDQINANIESGDYNLETAENQAATGFPALGFLLHGIGENNQQIVSQFTTANNASNRMTYLQDNVDFILDNANAILNEWGAVADADNFLETFLSKGNRGTDVGSSLGMLVNAYILHYERFLRDGKIGIPSGVRSAGVPRASATEAFYAGYSNELAIANLQAVERVFLGTGLNGTGGTGLEENLIALDATSLSDEITAQQNEALTALQGLDDPLSSQIENNNEPVTAAFQEMQDVLVLIKADMASALGVSITFQDNDGD